MLTVCTFKWRPSPGYRSRFTAESVRVLHRKVAEHYPSPHRFVCITDDPSGLDGIETVPLWNDYADVPSPHGGRNPSCYRRLKLFDPAIREVLGARVACIDLDTVIVDDIRPLLDRTEEFVIWGETDPRSWYNGSMMLLTTGSRPQVWTDFNPRTSPRQAKAAGRFGSDQGWISHCLGKGEATWTRDDGVYSFRVHMKSRPSRLPENARMVMFHGKVDPWSHDAQQFDWVREHWGIPA